VEGDTRDGYGRQRREESGTSLRVCTGFFGHDPTAINPNNDSRQWSARDTTAADEI